jgi:hypothetical protein
MFAFPLKRRTPNTEHRTPNTEVKRVPGSAEVRGKPCGGAKGSLREVTGFRAIENPGKSNLLATSA